MQKRGKDRLLNLSIVQRAHLTLDLRAFANSSSSILVQLCRFPSYSSVSATLVSLRADSDKALFPGSPRNTFVATSALVSHFSASRRARANVRRIPRVRWKLSSCVHLAYSTSVRSGTPCTAWTRAAVQPGAGGGRSGQTTPATSQRARSRRSRRRDRRQLRAEVLEAGSEQLDEDVLLRPDEVVDGRVAHAGGVGQATHREAVEPVCFDELRGGVEDPLPPPLLALLPAPPLQPPASKSYQSISLPRPIGGASGFSVGRRLRRTATAGGRHGIRPRDPGRTVVDGTGRRRSAGDVAIDGDRITAVGDVDGRRPRVDRRGRAVS